MRRSVASLSGVTALAVATEVVYYALATKYGIWAAVAGDTRFLWAYGSAVVLYLTACLLIWARQPRGRLALGVILAFAVLFRLTLLAEPAEPYGDIYRYVWDGRVSSAGINPYLYPPSAPELAALAIPELSSVNSPDTPTPYPPLAEGLFASEYLLWPGNLFMMKATFVAFDLATIVLLMILLRHFRRPAIWSITYAWSPLPIVEFAGHGHVDAVFLPLLLLALLLALRGRGAWSGIALASATLLKVAPVLLAPVLLRRWGWRGMVPYGVAVAIGVLPFLGAGPRFMGGAQMMADRWEANAGLYYWGAMLSSNLQWFGETQYPARLAVAAAVAAFVILLTTRKLDDDRSLVAACFWVFAVLLLVSPAVFPWYVTWILPMLTLLLPVGRTDPCWPAFAGWWIFTCAAGIFYLKYLTGSWPEVVAIAEFLPAYAGTIWAAAVFLGKHPSPGSIAGAS